MRTLLSATLLLTLLITPLFSGPAEEYDLLYKEYSAAGSPAEWRVVIEKFERFAERKDAGLYRANAYYWLGEREYSIRNYYQALVQFEKALTIPNSWKERDARLKVILCYVKLEKWDTARWEIDRFERQFTEEKDIKVVADLRRQLK